jgi:hypothetical protein
MNTTPTLQSVVHLLGDHEEKTALLAITKRDQRGWPYRKLGDCARARSAENCQAVSCRKKIKATSSNLEGDANGAPHPDPSSYAKKFSGKYTHRDIKGGVGHNLPQEAPQVFANAVFDVDHF